MKASYLFLLVGVSCAPKQPLTQAKPSSATSHESVNVTLPAEPRIPKPCATLVAMKVQQNGFLREADESALDTARIQAALDACPAGASLRLQAAGERNAFVSGPLELRNGVTLWIDSGTTLFASRNPRDYDRVAGTASCGTNRFDDGGGCKPFILAQGVTAAGIVGGGVIDGRGGEPMLGSEETWWDVAQDAKLKNLRHSNPRLIDVLKSRDFTLYGITLQDSPKFHASINSQGFVVWGVTVVTPARAHNSRGRALTPKYARNTDAINPTGATDGVIAHCRISTGDDNVAIKAGPAGPVKNLLIAHNRFGAGHGMSIGSETQSGVEDITVYDLSIDGDVDSGGEPDVDLNGIRIKTDVTRGGLVRNVRYVDVCIRDLPNPIILTPHYSEGARGTLIPSYQGISFQNVYSLLGRTRKVPTVTLMGYDAQRPLDASFEGVSIEGLRPEGVRAEFAELRLGSGVNLPVDSSAQVRVSGNTSASATLPRRHCLDKFEPAYAAFVPRDN